LLVCLPVCLSAFAADVGVPGGDSAGDVTGGIASGHSAIEAREAPARGPYAASRAARIAPPKALTHDEGRSALARRSARVGARGYISKPAVAVVTRAYGTFSAATARRALNRPVSNFKAVAGNGIIGGPHAPGGGTIGGPASGRTVIKAAIDGSALHRRS
jgi:hypothetical protein